MTSRGFLLNRCVQQAPTASLTTTTSMAACLTFFNIAKEFYMPGACPSSLVRGNSGSCHSQTFVILGRGDEPFRSRIELNRLKATVICLRDEVQWAGDAVICPGIEVFCVMDEMICPGDEVICFCDAVFRSGDEVSCFKDEVFWPGTAVFCRRDEVHWAADEVIGSRHGVH